MIIKKYSLIECRSNDGEGNGKPLQYSFLENPMDRGPGGLEWKNSSLYLLSLYGITDY